MVPCNQVSYLCLSDNIRLIPNKKLRAIIFLAPCQRVKISDQESRVDRIKHLFSSLVGPLIFIFIFLFFFSSFFIIFILVVGGVIIIPNSHSCP